MHLTTPLRRRLAFGALMALALAGCGGLPTGPRQIDISESQLLARMSAQLPVKQRYLGLFEVTLDQPRLRLRPEENRLGNDVAYRIEVALPGMADIRGRLEMSYSLRFEPSDTTLRLTQARIERLDVEGLNAAQAAQVRKVGGLLSEDLMKEAVVHRFRKEDLESLAGRGYRPGAIRVVPGGLRIQLDLIQ
ncbi:hypothetical protein [Hydrogenophaga sp. RWCD_12]|uniref:hypothetical protein n=1 Tax=Hydrogenophaga sp. RWCD_12 TaxID=3391190 RepID=UPI003984AA9D